MIDWRPCGACRELVPADSGCGHWRPGVSSGMRAGETAQDREAKAKAAAKRREQRARARELAKKAIEEFHRQQGIGEAT